MGAASPSSQMDRRKLTRELRECEVSFDAFEKRTVLVKQFRILLKAIQTKALQNVNISEIRTMRPSYISDCLGYYDGKIQRGRADPDSASRQERRDRLNARMLIRDGWRYI